MKKNWWKILAVLLIVYSFAMGLLTPLRTGISGASPRSVKAGQTFTMQVQGYNSYFTQSKNELRAWLKMDSAHAIAADKIEVLNDRDLNLTFELPAYLPTSRKVQNFTLIVDSPKDGAAVLPEGLYVTQEKIDPSQGAQLWQNDKITDLHEKNSITFPYRNILYETIRNLYYHVPLWFAMFILFIAAVVQSVLFLKNFDEKNDQRAAALTSVGILYGILGLITGAIWAKNTWGAFWSWDVKQNMTAVGLLIYGAYFVLRNSFEDPEKKARISAVYNIFAFATLVPLLYVIPKLTDSLHPGAGGNIAFGSQDLDHTMRLVFYPAIIGWALFGVWVASLVYRTNRLRERLLGGE
ncbi:MAG TPA: cytochrome c assembly protein [Bacteroidetes bacterium]|nr:cytochrome c assembly protein [Bacteroidota bacterium]